MSLFHLILRELSFRKLSFVHGVLAVLVAVGCLVAQVVVLAQHDLRTEELVAAKEQETEKVMAKLNDEIRKDMKSLGFNLRILPKGVNLHDYLARDYADKYMPEEYADRLANSKIITINHLAPVLQQRIDWPEKKGPPVILVGTRGELPILQQDKKKPIQQAVPKGKIVLGHHVGHGYKPGDTADADGPQVHGPPGPRAARRHGRHHALAAPEGRPGIAGPAGPDQRHVRAGLQLRGGPAERDPRGDRRGAAGHAGGGVRDAGHGAGRGAQPRRRAGKTEIAREQQHRQELRGEGVAGGAAGAAGRAGGVRVAGPAGAGERPRAARRDRTVPGARLPVGSAVGAVPGPGDARGSGRGRCSAWGWARSPRRDWAGRR